MHWTLETVPLDSLRANPKNPRSLSKKQFSNLKKSIQKFGQCVPLVANTDGLLIGGHQRLKAMKAIGHVVGEVYFPDGGALSDEDVKELLIRLNKNTGEWSDEILANEWETDHLLEWGFTEKELGLGVDENIDKPKKFTINIKCSDEDSLREIEREIEGILHRYEASYKVKIK